MTQKSSYDPAVEDAVLRVSKSSFTTYLRCPRQYCMDYIALYDLEKPRSPAAARGTEIHQLLEDVMKADAPGTYLSRLPITADEGIVALGELMDFIEEDMGPEGIEIVGVEQKFSVWDDELDCELSGIIDGIWRHPEGGLILVELKTGNLTSSKMSRFRKELAFYSRMLSLHPDYATEEITHYAVIAPDCVDAKFVTSLLNQKRQTRDVYLGQIQGAAIVEPVTNRSISGMERDLHASVDGIKNHDWPINWNEYFCTQWCDYTVSCDTELMTGVSSI